MCGSAHYSRAFSGPKRNFRRYLWVCGPAGQDIPSARIARGFRNAGSKANGQRQPSATIAA
ncbi:hypothetical protein PUN4_560062 [Paraburkholderia unamae]|nr:hypothetical protein PUN4_560062 [Paraburkholderia unamae]